MMKHLVRRRRGRFGLFASLGLVVVLLGGFMVAAAAAAPVTIGQTNAAADYICSQEIDTQSAVAAGPGYVVPAGGGLLTSWSTFAGYLLNISGTVTGTSDLLASLLTATASVGPGTSLADKVKLIQGYFAASDKADACGTLGAFVNQVKAQTGKTVSTGQAASLTSQANTVMATLGC